MTSPSPGVPARAVGVPGVVRGVAVELLDAEPVPTTLMAETRKRYSVPLASDVAV